MKERIKRFLNKEINFFGGRKSTDLATFEVIKPEGTEQPEVTVCLSEVSKSETETILRGNFKSLNLSGNTALFKIDNVNFTFVSLSVHIITLDLSYCSIAESGKVFFSALLKDNNTLENLDISNNNLEDDCLEGVKNKTLKSLDVHSNNLADLACEHICCYFCLKFLDISSNQVTNNGASYLSLSPSLESLAINNNQISFSGADNFLESNLKEIFISNNAMNQTQEDDFFFAFYENISRVELSPKELKALEAIDFSLDW